MAKRVRGSSSRPGQRAPLQRSATTPRPTSTAGAATSASAVVTPSSGLTADEEARAAALEAQIVADEQAAETTARRQRSRRAIESEGGVASGAIAMSASQEYAYVTRDVRRIVVIGGGLVAVLLGLWAVITVTGVGPF